MVSLLQCSYSFKVPLLCAALCTAVTRETKNECVTSSNTFEKLYLDLSIVEIYI